MLQLLFWWCNRAWWNHLCVSSSLLSPYILDRFPLKKNKEKEKKQFVKQKPNNRILKQIDYFSLSSNFTLTLT